MDLVHLVTFLVVLQEATITEAPDIKDMDQTKVDQTLILLVTKIILLQDLEEIVEVTAGVAMTVEALLQ